MAEASGREGWGAVCVREDTGEEEKPMRRWNSGLVYGPSGAHG